MLAFNTDLDQNKIEECLLTEYFLKIVRLVVIILALSYFFGIFFLVVCEAVLDFQFEVQIQDFRDGNLNLDDYPELFLTYFGFSSLNSYEMLIISTYFACTSLSTVGFGDFTPRGNVERFLGAFILLFGVAIFSIVLGNLIDILGAFKEFHKDIGDGEALSQFFGTIKYFNNEQSLDLKLQNQIEELFNYRWANDKLAALSQDEDVNNFDQLPAEVQLTIYTEFLFKVFLDSYKVVFSFPNILNPNQPSVFSWQDYHYRGFMQEIMASLEPRQEFSKVLLFDENDEINEVIFFIKGVIDLGYKINKKEIYCLRLHKDSLLGAYNLCTNKRTKFIYKT